MLELICAVEKYTEMQCFYFKYLPGSFIYQIEKDRIINWVLSLQALPATTADLREGMFNHILFQMI